MNLLATQPNIYLYLYHLWCHTLILFVLRSELQFSLQVGSKSYNSLNIDYNYRILKNFDIMLFGQLHYSPCVQRSFDVQYFINNVEYIHNNLSFNKKFLKCLVTRNSARYYVNLLINMFLKGQHYVCHLSRNPL